MTTTIDNSRKARNQDQLVASTVQSKRTARNFRAALLILCTLTIPTELYHTKKLARSVVQPSTAVYRRTAIYSTGNIRYTAGNHPRRRAPQHLMDRLDYFPGQ